MDATDLFSSMMYIHILQPVNIIVAPNFTTAILNRENEVKCLSSEVALFHLNPGILM